MTDLTYRDLFAQHRDLRRKLQSAKTSAEAGAIEVQISSVRELRLALWMQLMDLARSEQRKVMQ